MDTGSRRSLRRFLRFFLLVAILFFMTFALTRTHTARLAGPFELEAAEQWIVRQDDATEFVARHTLGRRQAIQEVDVYSFERNDIVDVVLLSNVTEGMVIDAGTRVLELHSMSDSARQRMLEARVDRLQQQLALSQQGELQARVAEARAGLALAQTNVLSYTPILMQQRELASQGIVPQVDLQLTEAEYSRRMQEMRVAESTLRVREMQSAPGVVAMARAELEEAQQELAMVSARLDGRWLHTPIRGRLTRESGDPAILLRVMQEHRLDARIALPATFLDVIQVGDPVVLKPQSYGSAALTSHVARLFVQSVPTLGQSILHVLAPVDNSDGKLRASMTGRALLPSVHIDPLRMLWHRIRSYFGDVDSGAVRRQ
jgi:hypothetical protein